MAKHRVFETHVRLEHVFCAMWFHVVGSYYFIESNSVLFSCMAAKSIAAMSRTNPWSPDTQKCVLEKCGKYRGITVCVVGTLCPCLKFVTDPMQILTIVKTVHASITL